MPKYKADQGTYARTSSWILLGSLAAYGAYTLYFFLLSMRSEDNTPSFFANDLSGGDVPVLGFPLTPAFAIALLVGVGSIWWLGRLLDKPKVADMLIETETEMRKCHWPTWGETFNVSMVVFVVMIFFTFMLAAMDYVLNGFMINWVL